MVILPFLTGDFSMHRLSWHLDDPKLALVLIYLASWTTFAVEGPSLFAPEYRQPGTDTPKAIRACAVVMLAIFTIVPFVATGTIGDKAIGANPSGYAVDVMTKVWPGTSSMVIAVLALGLWVTLIGTSAQAGRALLGISRSDLTIKQLSTLNKFGMPGRALSMDLGVNLLILFLVGNTVAIVAASNFGYILCCGLACFAFILLRRDRPAWPRPYQLSGAWIGVALIVGTIDLIIAGFGVSHPSLAGYGGLKETVISLALLLVCVPLFLYRRVWQDRASTFLWREHTPHLPTDTEHVADQYADLDELTVQPDSPLIGGHGGPSEQPI
jgi:amino acid transporter